MTAAPRPCLTHGCYRLPRPEWAYCEGCADRLIAGAIGAPSPDRMPEWLRRRNASLRDQGRVAYKDLTAA